jgi:hypothetical protein
VSEDGREGMCRWMVLCMTASRRRLHLMTTGSRKRDKKRARKLAKLADTAYVGTVGVGREASRARRKDVSTEDVSGLILSDPAFCFASSL